MTNVRSFRRVPNYMCIGDVSRLFPGLQDRFLMIGKIIGVVSSKDRGNEFLKVFAPQAAVRVASVKKNYEVDAVRSAVMRFIFGRRLAGPKEFHCFAVLMGVSSALDRVFCSPLLFDFDGGFAWSRYRI